jgi:hypothetical protein
VSSWSITSGLLITAAQNGFSLFRGADFDILKELTFTAA